MINWDYMITYGGPELFVAFAVIVITPFIYWLILKRFNLTVKITSIASIWIVAIFIAYWDVYQISIEAERLCREEAGLHVYKTVEAEGFLDDNDIEYWSKYGFQYVERDYFGKKTRYTLEDSVAVEEKVNHLKSDYEYTKDSSTLLMPFTKGRKMIQDRKTGEVLGEIVTFAVYPGWLDSRLLGILGFSWSPKACEDDQPPARGHLKLSYKDLVKAVIKPINTHQGDES